MILKSLLRRRTRTLLTIIGIAIGVAVVVALGAMVDGFVAQFSDIGRKSGADLTAMQAKAADITFSSINEDLGRRIAAVPGVKAVAGVHLGMISTPATPYFIYFGLDPRAFGIAHFKISEGRAITPASQRELMLGRTAAKMLKKKLGDTVKIFDGSFRIVGIYETGVSFEDGGGVMPLKEAQALSRKNGQVSMLFIRVKNVDNADQLRADIERRFPELSVAKSTEFAERTQDVQVTRSLAWAISLIAIVVGGVGMMNTMLMSVFERTREIGTLRAVGWRRRRIMSMILQESLLLGAVGGVAGIVIGVLLVKLVELSPAVSTMLKGSFSPGLFVQALAVAFALGAIGGLYPAYKAAGLNPIEALRYE